MSVPTRNTFPKRRSSVIRVVFFFLLTLFSFTSVCNASETLTVDALIHGVNQARLTIQSGEVYTVTSEKYAAQKSEEEIAVWMKEKQERELKNFTPDPLYPNIDVKKFEKDYLTPKLKASVHWMRQHTRILHATTLFQILEPDTVIHPTLYHYKLTQVDSPDHSLESEVHFHPGGLSVIVCDIQTQVKQTLGNIVFPYDSVNFFGSDTHGGYWRFSLFGRSPFRVPADAEHVGKETIEGAECHILAFTSENKQNIHIWVDPAKDFCLHKIEYLRSPITKHIRARRAYKQFQKFGDVWFPKIAEDTVYEEDGTVPNRFIVEVAAAEFNVDFPKDFFKIDRDFYLPPDRRSGMGLFPDSGTSPTTPTTETDPGLLLCGPQSLLRICELLKVETTLIELQKLSGFNPNRGTTMLGLKAAATYKGLAPTGVRASIELLQRKKVPLPAIAFVNNNHFLVFETVDKKGIKISDPAQKYSPHVIWDELSEIWGGDLLIFDKNRARRAKQKQAPLAFTETSEYDFGKVLGGSEVKHTFTIKNIGQKPLKILSVTETCACAASVLSQDEIAPNKTGHISAILTVPSGNQRVQESLLVLTNDPVQSTLTLMLKGEAFTPLKTFPERLTFGNREPLQKPLTKRVSLHRQEEVQILNVRTDSEHLKATLKTEDDIPHVEVQLLPTLPVGQFAHNLLVDYTYEGKKTTHNVIAFGQILGELYVVPNRLFFGLIKDPSAASKTITISSRDTQPFQITDVVSSTKAVTVKVKGGDSENHYQVTTTLAPTAVPGELTGEVVIHTSSSVQPTVRVPFFGIVAGTK